MLLLFIENGKEISAEGNDFLSSTSISAMIKFQEVYIDNFSDTITNLLLITSN